ncbi:hypothetical protein [Streptomyces sp. NBC_01500]|uniref:hypothetical protein n=1 Tax=Streptomyces sp. NBC_01500 TaxID=2903886 RepID=UPI002257AB84|nr:hypothetical protein [Streptomyces sp. NBC_01500]MCX4549255.1 hypothetical protein [Streptomyces sp. NBC_01500]
MSADLDYRAERRADGAAAAEQRRLDAQAADERRAERTRAADERAARLQEQGRAEQIRRRTERAERRAQAFTPRSVYRTGTLALVIASGLASLPAQVLHFVGISPMLLPLPLALEGAAWVMAAGVAYADARALPGWVRWLLRTLVLFAAGFAASINYRYGLSLKGLSSSDASTAGIGLAAVTLLGPGLFEIRQWVSTLAAAEGGSEGRAQRRHARTRRRHHRPVAKVTDRLLSAAPHGSVSFEDAWARAWEIHTGTDEHGMTPDLHRRAVKSATELAAARLPTKPDTNPKKTTDLITCRSMSDLRQSAPAPTAVRLPRPVPVGFLKPTQDSKPTTPRKPTAARVSAAQSARPRRATGRVPAVARTPRRVRTTDELLTEARKATADWSTDQLTADAIRKAVRTSASNGRMLRDTLRAERTTSATSTQGEAA